MTLVIAAGIGFIKGWIVPGKYYEREVTNVQKATDAAEQNRKSIETLTKVLEDRREQFDRLIELMLQRKRDQ